jgi:hypothetical protein
MPLSFAPGRELFDPVNQSVRLTATDGPRPVTCFVYIRALEQCFGMRGDPAGHAIPTIHKNWHAIVSAAAAKYRGSDVVLDIADFGDGTAR